MTPSTFPVPIETSNVIFFSNNEIRIEEQTQIPLYRKINVKDLKLIMIDDVTFSEFSRATGASSQMIAGGVLRTFRTREGKRLMAPQNPLTLQIRVGFWDGIAPQGGRNCRGGKCVKSVTTFIDYINHQKRLPPTEITQPVLPAADEGDISPIHLANPGRTGLQSVLKGKEISFCMP